VLRNTCHGSAQTERADDYLHIREGVHDLARDRFAARAGILLVVQVIEEEVLVGIARREFVAKLISLDPRIRRRDGSSRRSS
jgi:hypothetical protein